MRVFRVYSNGSLISTVEADTLQYSPAEGIVFYKRTENVKTGFSGREIVALFKPEVFTHILEAGQNT